MRPLVNQLVPVDAHELGSQGGQIATELTELQRLQLMQRLQNRRSLASGGEQVVPLSRHELASFYEGRSASGGLNARSADAFGSRSGDLDRGSGIASTRSAHPVSSET